MAINLFCLLSWWSPACLQEGWRLAIRRMPGRTGDCLQDYSSCWDSIIAPHYHCEQSDMGHDVSGIVLPDAKFDVDFNCSFFSNKIMFVCCQTWWSAAYHVGGDIADCSITDLSRMAVLPLKLFLMTSCFDALHFIIMVRWQMAAGFIMLSPLVEMITAKDGIRARHQVRCRLSIQIASRFSGDIAHPPVKHFVEWDALVVNARRISPQHNPARVSCCKYLPPTPYITSIRQSGRRALTYNALRGVRRNIGVWLYWLFCPFYRHAARYRHSTLSMA